MLIFFNSYSLALQKIKQNLPSELTADTVPAQWLPTLCSLLLGVFLSYFYFLIFCQDPLIWTADSTTSAKLHISYLTHRILKILYYRRKAFPFSPKKRCHHIEVHWLFRYCKKSWQFKSETFKQQIEYWISIWWCYMQRYSSVV